MLLSKANHSHYKWRFFSIGLFEKVLLVSHLSHLPPDALCVSGPRPSIVPWCSATLLVCYSGRFWIERWPTVIYRVGDSPPPLAARRPPQPWWKCIDVDFSLTRVSRASPQEHTLLHCQEDQILAQRGRSLRQQLGPQFINRAILRCRLLFLVQCYGYIKKKYDNISIYIYW